MSNVINIITKLQFKFDQIRVKKIISEAGLGYATAYPGHPVRQNLFSFERLRFKLSVIV